MNTLRHEPRHDDGHSTAFVVVRGHVAPLRAILDDCDDHTERGEALSPELTEWYRLTCHLLAQYAPTEKW